MADSDDRTSGADSVAPAVLGALKRGYHIPILAGVMLYMFWSRFQNYDAFTREGEGFWLQAIDSWYHWRATSWMVENVPWTLSFESWTGFPDGTAPGQFGTMFDQIVVVVSLILGLGSPGQSDVLMAALATVPALAALVAVPVYYLGKHLGTRVGGLAGAGLLALFTGEFFTRSTAGQFQHHAAEALFMAIAVFAVVVALTVAERERPVWELVRKGEWASLRRPTVYAAAAGLAVTLYIWVWPPGIVLVGILGLYFVLQLSVDQVRGRSPDHLAYVGVVSMAVVAVGTAARIEQPGFSATGLDFFQPTLALLVAGGCVFMAAVARLWEANSLPRWSYPAAIVVSVLGALGGLAVVLPDVPQTLLNNLTGRIVPFGQSESALTVAEIDPPNEFFTDYVQDEYGWAFYTGLLALPVLVVQSVLRPEKRGRYLFVLVWALVLISMGMTQVRFNYYLAVGVAVLNAHLVGFLTAGIGFPESVDDIGESLANSQAYLQVMVVVLVVTAVFIPLLPPVASTTPMSVGDETGPSPDGVVWEGSNEWLAENTPAVGNYGGADNAAELDYDGRYGWPEGGSFDYPEGAYGVMSWWDYGHLITVQGNRIPHANPFQQNARSASAFLTAQNESQAELYLDAIAAGEEVTHESNESELRQAVEESNSPPGIQYVMIDDETATGKFSAITAWTGPDYFEYLDEEERTFLEGTGENRTQNPREVFVGEDYYDTMTARLYLEDADGLEHYRLVRESPRYSIVGFFGNLQTSQRIGVVEDFTNAPRENGTSLANTSETFSQARAGDFAVPLGTQDIHDPYVTSTVKTFERVEGATLTGETALDGTVEASVTLRTASNRTFTYSQSTEIEDGSYELTVAYPTEETLGPDDGYANASVRANSTYTLTGFDASGEAIEEATNVTVPEAAVQNGKRLDVELTEIPDPPESNLSGLDIGGQGNETLIAAGEDASVSVDVQNVGEEPGEFSLFFSAGNATASEAADELGPNKSTTVTFDNVTTALDPGTYTPQVTTNNDSVTGLLVVEPESDPAEPSLSGLDIAGQGPSATVDAGTAESVSVTVSNAGERAGTFDVNLSVGETVQNTQSTGELGPGESTTLTFEGVTTGFDTGSFDVTAVTRGNSVGGSLTVEGNASALVAARAARTGTAG